MSGTDHPDAGSALGAAQPVVETDVTIKTPDGTCDAAFFHPPTGSHPGVLIWTDAFDLRPAMRDIGKRIAAEGYSVLVPNDPLVRKAPSDLLYNQIHGAVVGTARVRTIPVTSRAGDAQAALACLAGRRR